MMDQEPTQAAQTGLKTEAPNNQDQEAVADQSEVEAMVDARESEAPEPEAPETKAPEAGTSGLVALEQAQAEIDQLKDQLQRTLADNQNVRRRAEQDVEKAHKFGVEKLIKELLPVVDNLERALQNVPADAEQSLKPVLDGITMTHQSFISSLAKFQVSPIDPEGEPFDPERHQAMSLVDAPDAEPNTVLTVVQKGYSLHGRLLRPAMVMVSKAAVRVDEQV